ncbi:MAG TPA: putative peptide modification system cyclase [Dokdonella sp.]|uniref:putative peptide modification system cyclase n=1 Tax=Dokdonella sp. TaxID=2291710 RepID=UPI002B8F2C91|nr:putative peptide modification system cyclase [Dokdonella sp.]HUD43707.1 putative peptide modification system cyclase [Dokdonella sp.]
MEATAQSLPDPARDRAKPLLRTLVLCDLVDSTALVHKLGDLAATHLIRRHDRFARALLQVHDGHEIDKTDGFLLMFDRPIQAVAFALDYQRNLHQFNLQEGSELKARVGIHVGDVLLWDNGEEEIAKGAKPVDIEGLAKPVTSRLASLARPGQILLSGVTWSLAHRAQGELSEPVDKIRWRAHGRFRFKGVPEPIPVFEVGEEGLAPFRTPPWSGKAHREVPFWRRPSVLVFEALLIALAIIVPVYMMLRSPPAIAFASRDWVVVGDFQNHTDQSIFDDSLQVAFRIGLEQSRYVNILSDLKVRDTVMRMKRDPTATPIDRAIGSEVALRDGARALILPSIAEIGGRVRVTAEVVDPKTQTTVYSESADGVGADSVLPSLDKVNRQLRERLGEAVAVISTDAKPLEKATTSNLDALRAYSLAVAEDSKGNTKEAIPLFRQAVALDGDFALARVGLGRTLLLSGSADAAEVKRELEQAVNMVDRLSTRDALYAQAWLANNAAPRAALEKWQLMEQLYPDSTPASGGMGYFSWQAANDFGEAIRAIEKIAVATNPRRGMADYLLATLYLGQERFADAHARFKDAQANGFSSRNLFYAHLFAAQRSFDQADALLTGGKSTGIATSDADIWYTRVALALDRGRWNDALGLLEQAQAETRTLRGSRHYDLQTIEQIMKARSAPGADSRAALAAYFKQIEGSTLQAPSRQFNQLMVAYLAATQDDVELAQRALAAAAAFSRKGDYPYLSSLMTVVEAELLRAQGKPREAIALLEPYMDGREYYFSHQVLLDAHRAAGDDAAALKQARWLAEHRGRAYAEQFGQLALIPFNVMLSDLAWLEASTLAARAGRAEDAADAKSRLLTAWPEAMSLGFVRRQLAPDEPPAKR